MRWLFVLVAALAGIVPALAQSPCNADAPCAIEGGEYYLSFPAGWDGETPLKALLFYHGHRSSGLSVINSGGMRSAFSDHGWLLIAPNGAARDDGVRAWPARPLPPDDGRRDDVAFTLAVVEDVARRVPLDRDRLFVGGFSAGGSMAYMVACYAGQGFTGFVSVAGALRRPVPDGPCPAGPVRMLHIHGYSDTQVPLEGRGLGDWHQGDAFESLAILRATDQCRSNPTAIDLGEQFWCRSWDECGSDASIRFCLHDGGHGLPRGWSDMARDWMEQVGHAS